MFCHQKENLTLLSLNTSAGDKIVVDVDDKTLTLTITDADGGVAVAVLNRREAQVVNYVLQTLQYELLPTPVLPDGSAW